MRRMTLRLLKMLPRVILWIWAERVLQDVAAGENSPGSAVLDVNLMYEFLLSGVESDQDNNIVLVDKEMASMRPGRAFLTQINDNVPRGVSAMLQMANTLKAHKRRPLTQDQFQTLVLSMVYAAHQARNLEGPEEHGAWGGALLQLANVTVQELRGSYLFSYT